MNFRSAETPGFHEYLCLILLAEFQLCTFYTTRDFRFYLSVNVISDSSIRIVPRCHFRFQLLCACVNVLSTTDLCNRGHLHQATFQNVTSTYAVVLTWRPLCCLSAVMCPLVGNPHQWWSLHDACYLKSTLISIHAGRHTCWPLHMLSPERAVLYVCCP
jgi:hypothetical protein